MKRKIYVLYGGISVEHEIALRSARSILNNLDKERYDIHPVYITKTGSWIPGPKNPATVERPEDLILETDKLPAASLGAFLSDVYDEKEDNLFIPVIHGTMGEDGVIQGLMECLGAPYVGNGVLASAVCMDKAVANQIFESCGIPQAAFLVATAEDYKNGRIDFDHVEATLGFPLFVKPANAGSSVGVSRTSSKEELKSALETAFRYDRKAVLEEEVVGLEAEISVVGNEAPKASLAGTFLTKRSFFDYYAKYLDAELVRQIPMDLPEEESAALRQVAVDAYVATGCRGFARVDVFIRDSDRALLVNEINTFPGMTDSSLSAELWNVTDGTTYPELLQRLIDLADEEFAKRKQLVTSKESEE